MSHFNRVALCLFIIFAPHILGGAMCSRALDLPIIVKATLPNEFSKESYTLNVEKALSEAGIKATNGKIPAGAPASIKVEHTDVFDLTKQSQFNEYSSRVNQVYINYVSAEITKNNLSIGLPRIDLSLAPMTSGTLNGQEKFDVVAELPPLAQGIIGTPAEIVWEEERYQQANEYLKQFIIGVRMTAEIKLTPGADIPKGIVDFNLNIEATFVLKLL